MREGAAEVRRDGRRITAGSATTLGGRDTVVLAPRSSGAVILEGSSVALQGPQTLEVSELLSKAEPASTNNSPAPLRRALFDPPGKITGLLVVRRSSQSIRVYSPMGVTASLTPVILWSHEPGKTYDLSLTDQLRPEVPALRRSKALSPVEFAKAWPRGILDKDGLYRLWIAETGQPLTATEVTFRTSTDANGTITPTADVLAAYRSLTADPPCVGDALADLFLLPPESAKSQLALRLKLFALGQLGYDQEFHAVLGQLQSSSDKP
jgi:hypothetical protein